MKKITLDTSFQTVSSGTIDVKDGFKLSKEFDYYGKVSINASNPLITFEGATRINHSCENFERNWLSFASQISTDRQSMQVLYGGIRPWLIALRCIQPSCLNWFSLVIQSS
jgi:hypothetical protein